MATIFGTNGADILRGTSSADAIYGFWGDDSITGGLGRDFLYGGMGNDTLDGGAGRNVLDGGGGFDLVLYSSRISPVRADLRTGVVGFPNGATDTLIDIEAIDGGSGADRFIGNGAGNRFWGSGGNDTLIGNFGSDTLLGGGGADSLDGGSGQDSLVGGFGNDTMRGGAHDDIFSFGPIVRLADPYTLALVDYGRDVIDGGAGTDALVIDGPSFWVAYSDDKGGDGGTTGIDTGAPAVRANLGAGTLRIGDSSNRSTLISIENIETGSGDDSINGSSGDNFIRAGDGMNVVYAGAGDDTIIGGNHLLGDDEGRHGRSVEILNGGAGDDAIYGMGSWAQHDGLGGGGSAPYAGTDIFVGGAGNDTLYGGGNGDGVAPNSAAIQIMTGGAGNDIFVLTDFMGYEDDGSSISFQLTTITDFERGRDKIDFDFSDFTGRITFRGESAGDLAAGDLAYSHDGADTIVQLRIEDDGFSDPSIYDTLTIILSDYTGPLSASDFDLG